MAEVAAACFANEVAEPKMQDNGMNAKAIMKALAKADKGMASEALNNVLEADQPGDLPAAPETEAMGPPDDLPPVETGEMPGFDPSTGLPTIVTDKLPEDFRSGEDDEDGDDIYLIL